MRKKLLLPALLIIVGMCYSFTGGEDKIVKEEDKKIGEKPDYAYEARPEFIEGGDVGILVIHGFRGSPQSMREIAHKLNYLGYTVSVPLLAGHGRTPEIMEKSTYKDWIKSVNDAYNELRPKVKKIFVLGLSMGGTQVLHCAANRSIDGAITINGSVSMDPSAPLPNLSRSPEFIGDIGLDMKKPGVKEWAYDKTPTTSLESMGEFRVVVSKELSKVTAPILIFKSREDHVVPPQVADYIYKNVSSTNKKLIVLENSNHVATLGNDQDLIVEQTNEFIKSIIR